MTALHVVQGGVDNGDLALLRAVAPGRPDSPDWVVPKAAFPGDEVVIYIAGHGFCATARIVRAPLPRKDWINRYGAPLAKISLIEPPLSLGTIQRRLPDFKWARYPRSITTPSAVMAKTIRRLIADRRRNGVRDISDDALEHASLLELRHVALLAARPTVTPQKRGVIYRARALAIRLYALKRADGFCESCASKAPFCTPAGIPYLESHHTTQLADDGPDHPDNVIALCPNCHRRAHLSADADPFNNRLKRQVRAIERKRAAQLIGLYTASPTRNSI